uniref:Uncharacterized protein n=1 Tax=Lepeophtheirus salmonis TaxID=72036 RepID=A0A0K2TIW5_LEPSM
MAENESEDSNTDKTYLNRNRKDVDLKWENVTYNKRGQQGKSPSQDKRTRFQRTSKQK